MLGLLSNIIDTARLFLLHTINVSTKTAVYIDFGLILFFLDEGVTFKQALKHLAFSSGLSQVFLLLFLFISLLNNLYFALSYFVELSFFLLGLFQHFYLFLLFLNNNFDFFYFCFCWFFLLYFDILLADSPFEDWFLLYECIADGARFSKELAFHIWCRRYCFDNGYVQDVRRSLNLRINIVDILLIYFDTPVAVSKLVIVADHSCIVTFDTCLDSHSDWWSSHRRVLHH